MSIEAASCFVAQTELALEAAREAEAHATAAEEAIANRLSETESRCRKIRADHAAERLTDAQAGGLFHLAEQDRADLLNLHRDALVQVDEAVRQTQAAHSEHSRDIDDLSKAEAAAQFAAMRAYADELDGRLCQAVAELARRRPPDPVARRQRLGERRAQHHQPLAVERLGRPRTNWPKVQVTL